MSPKDLKTIHFLNKMIDAGVRVFKIEGRARGAEYVKNVVEAYDDAINAYIEGTFTEDKIAVWDTKLARVFNRGFWDGYYLGQRLGEWTSVYGSSATRVKVYLGKCTNFFGKIGVGNTTGAYESVVEEIRVDLKPVESVGKGVPFSIKTTETLHRNDKLYKMELQEHRRERGEIVK